MTRVLYVGSGFCSTHGLAAKLPKHLINHSAGIEVDVVVPHITGIDEGEGKLAERLVKCDPYVDGMNHHVTVLEGRRDGHIRTLYMHADCLTNGLSLNDDNGIRAAVVYAHAVCAWLSQVIRSYDLVHCDGIETALIPTIMRKFYAHDARVSAVKSIVSVKGIEDKAGIPMYWMEKIGFSSDMATSDGMEFYGKLSVLKGAYLYADAIAFPNTCIKRRIEKNRGKDMGMEGVLFDKLDKLHTIGIGICSKCVNPETDKAIEANYSVNDMAGKTKCKNAFTLKHRLKKGQPVVAYIGNLDADSGLSLVNDILDDLMDNKVNLVIAGTGNDNHVKTVNGWKDEFKGQIAFLNEKPACEDVRKILSASDIILLPSKHENTCTLHLAAMRYGCVVVAKNQGSLANDIQRVKDIDKIADNDNGFTFANFDSDEFYEAAMDALDVYESDDWSKIRENAMNKSVTLDDTANDCINIYLSLKA